MTSAVRASPSNASGTDGGPGRRRRAFGRGGRGRGRGHDHDHVRGLHGDCGRLAGIYYRLRAADPSLACPTWLVGFCSLFREDRGTEVGPEFLERTGKLMLRGHVRPCSRDAPAKINQWGR